MEKLTSLERVRTLLAHREPDRVGITDSYWLDTITRWQTEGFPADVTPAEYFGFDFDHVYIDSSLRLPEEVLEDTDAYFIYRDKHGFTAKRWKHKSGAFGYLEHEIKDRSDWERLKGNLALEYGTGCRMATIPYSDPFETYPEWASFKAAFDALRRRENYVLVVVYGPFEGTWRRHGFEAALMDLAADPGFAQEMFEAQVDMIIATLSRARLEGIVPDGLFLIEDMGYRSGTLFSRRAYLETLWPAHRRLGDFLRSQDIHYFLHSDGDISSFIPDFITAGFEVLQPIEAKIGLNVQDLKAEYGHDLSFMGNIDATIMSRSKAEIEAEIGSKLTAAKKGGGYIYHSDHSVPSDVSLEQYTHVMEMVLKYGRYHA